jgi:hypothetical protein
MTAKTYQQQQLEATPGRAILFLRAIATNQAIRFPMADVGYTEAEQTEGWRLLLDATGYAAQITGSPSDQAARQAIAELDNWDEGGFRRIHAALERLHPEQDKFVFAGLSPSRGPTAVVGVAKLLERLDQLEQGGNEDRSAIATLEKRGIDANLRAHLRGLVTTAQAASPMDLPSDAPSADTQQMALEALHNWYRDWSETARAVIRRRDHLILMGLAKRRTAQDDGTDSEEIVSAPDGQGGAQASGGVTAVMTN